MKKKIQIKIIFHLLPFIISISSLLNYCNCGREFHTTKSSSKLILTKSNPNRIVRRNIPATNVTNVEIGRRKFTIDEHPKDEWHTLLRKRKRLRQLRDEVRQLSSQFPPRFSRRGEVDKFKQRGDRTYPLQWRRLISLKLRTIMKRLKRLEKKKKFKRKKAKKKWWVEGVRFTEDIKPFTTTVNSNIKWLHSSISQSKNGESGGVCRGHIDCKPGLCCHKVVIRNRTLSAACVQHSLTVGKPCEDTCQCEPKLHCFHTRANSQMSSTPISGAVCIKLSQKDLANGISLNSKTSSFTETRRTISP